MSESINSGIGWFTTTYTKIIVFFTTYTGRSTQLSQIVFWGILVYLIVFLLIIPIQRSLKKKKIKMQKKLIDTIDEMIYLLARAQEVKDLDIKALGGNPNIALMQSIFTKGKADYIQSSFLIIDNIHKVEALLREKIVTREQEAAFVKTLKKYKRIYIWEKFFRGLALIFTFGIYAFFM